MKSQWQKKTVLWEDSRGVIYFIFQSDSKVLRMEDFIKEGEEMEDTSNPTSFIVSELWQ